MVSISYSFHIHTCILDNKRFIPIIIYKIERVLYMKDIIKKIIDTLFENIPFSKKSEEVKLHIQHQLESQFQDDIKNHTLNDLQLLAEQTQTLELACLKAGYSEEEISTFLFHQSILHKKDIQSLLKKQRKYILLETLLDASFVSIIFSYLLSFQLSSILFFVIYASVIIKLIRYVKKKRIAHSHIIHQICCDQEGRQLIESLHDKYVKKEINMFFINSAFLASLFFTLTYSIIASSYTAYDIFQQLFYHSTLIELCLFLTLKNIRFRHLFAFFFPKEKNNEFLIHLKKVLLYSGCFWTLMIILLFLLKNVVSYIFNVFIVILIIYFISLLIHNLLYRKQFVFQNIRLNVKRCLIISISVFIFSIYQIMSLDIYMTQPYINTLSKIQREEDQINYNDENGVYTITTNKDDFKILQLTDIHLGGSILSFSKDIKALKACEKLIRATEPDLVIVTGDLVFPMGIMSFSLNNRAPVMQFASFMRNMGIPWAFTYGNHDTEAMSVITDEQFDDLLKSLSYRSSQNLLYPYIQPDIYGRSHQLIEIRHQSGQLMQALFLMDSNDYIDGGKINEYDYIHDDQVEWYKKKVKQLSQDEGHTIPSMLFFHIPLQEYREAYELYEQKSEEVQYYYGETMIDKICASNYPSRLFDTAKELKSTKAMFCGHDHYNNLSLEYEGIRLTYGYSIDYLAMPGIEKDTKQRGGTLITIHQDGQFDIDPYRLIDIK